MLGIGLMLFCVRAIKPKGVWHDWPLAVAMWGMNIGLFMMCVMSLLPVGLCQTWAAVDTGYWYARSPEFLQLPYMKILRWMRVPGDTVFAIGAVALVLFMAGLITGHFYRKEDA